LLKIGILNIKVVCADVVGIFILLYEACSIFHVRVSARHAAEVGIGSTLSTSLKPGESKPSGFPPKPRFFYGTYVFIGFGFSWYTPFLMTCPK